MYYVLGRKRGGGVECLLTLNLACLSLLSGERRKAFWWHGVRGNVTGAYTEKNLHLPVSKV